MPTARAVFAATLAWFLAGHPAFAALDPGTLIKLSTSVLKVEVIRAQGGYSLGSGDAPVEITEYLDFECPVCASFAVIQMPTIKDQLINTGKVRWRYRDFPLPNHRYSRFSAHAAQCAGAQGRFFEMHDQLFYHHQWAQTGKDPSRLFRELAQAAAVNLDTYDACMEAGRYAQRIEFSRQEGDQLLVNGTPTFFANGKQLNFRRLPTSDDFKAVVDSIIAHSPAKPRTAPAHD